MAAGIIVAVRAGLASRDAGGGAQVQDFIGAYGYFAIFILMVAEIEAGRSCGARAWRT